MTGAQQPDALKRLVIFVITLAILGTLIALVGYFAVDLPQQNNVQVPQNSEECDILTVRLAACVEKCSELAMLLPGGHPLQVECANQCAEYLRQFEAVCTGFRS